MDKERLVAVVPMEDYANLVRDQYLCQILLDAALMDCYLDFDGKVGLRSYCLTQVLKVVAPNAMEQCRKRLVAEAEEAERNGK